MMQWWQLLPLFVFICLATAQTTPSTTRPTTPKVYPPETDRPKDMRNCRLNSFTIFPWIVGVWDNNFRQYVGHGSMITYVAFITTCKHYVRREHTRYRAVGQFIWNISLPEEPCMQEKMIQAIYIHPKCLESTKVATFFDFAVFRLVLSFDITGNTFPTLNFESSPLEMLNAAYFINIIPNTTGCMLPHFRNQNEEPPVFEFDSFVESIPFRTQCLPLLCEKLPANDTFFTMCQRRFSQRAPGTMLCVKNKNRLPVRLGSNEEYWYAGTPFICNGTVHGMAAQLKERRNFPSSNNEDIHFIVMFLRVWPWLVDLMNQHSAPWVNPIHIEDFSLKPEDYPTPSRDPIGGDDYDDFKPLSDATVIEYTIFQLFLYLFYSLFSLYFIY